MANIGIEAVEYNLPSRIVTNLELQSENPSWEMGRLVSRTGVKQRHIAGPNETALDLALAACRVLDDRQLLKPHEIDAVIFCTETPDHPIPPNACILHGRLGLRTNVMAFDVTLACSGFVYGLGLARSLIASGAARRVLLTTADTYSHLIHPGDRSSRTLFGDGGAATIVGVDARGLELLDMTFATSGREHERFIVKAGGSRVPRSPETARVYSDRSGNLRTAEHIEMDGLGVLSFFNSAIPKAIDELLSRNELSRDEIDCFVLHQASQVALDGIRHAMRLSPERVILDIAEVGNLVSASIPVALARALSAGRLKRGSLIVLCGFGVGLSWATALIRV